MLAARPKARPPSAAGRIQPRPATAAEEGQAGEHQAGGGGQGGGLVTHHHLAHVYGDGSQGPEPSRQQAGGEGCGSRPVSLRPGEHFSGLGRGQGQEPGQGGSEEGGDPPEVVPCYSQPDGGGQQERPAGRIARAHPVRTDLQVNLPGVGQGLRLGGVLDGVRPGMEARSLGLHGAVPPRRHGQGDDDDGEEEIVAPGHGGGVYVRTLAPVPL